MPSVLTQNVSAASSQLAPGTNAQATPKEAPGMVQSQVQQGLEAQALRSLGVFGRKEGKDKTIQSVPQKRTESSFAGKENDGEREAPKEGVALKKKTGSYHRVA